MISAESVAFLPVVKAFWCIARIARAFSSRVQPCRREEEKSPIAERLARYVNTQPEILRRGAQKVIYADLRYPNGYAIRMSSTEHQDRP